MLKNPQALMRQPCSVLKTRRQLVLFVMIGGVNTLFGYSLYALLLRMGMQYPVAVILSTLFGILFSFKTTGKIVFVHASRHAFLKYVVVYGFLCLINISLIRCLQSFFNLYWSGFVAMVPTAGFAFIANKYLVFREKT